MWGCANKIQGQRDEVLGKALAQEEKDQSFCSYMSDGLPKVIQSSMVIYLVNDSWA